MQRILVMRGGAVGDVILTLPAIGVLRLTFPRARIVVMGDAMRLCLARHPVYADAIIDAEQWEFYRLFGREPPAYRSNWRLTWRRLIWSWLTCQRPTQPSRTT